MNHPEFSIIFHPKAEEEYQQSFVWYEEQLIGLGERFEKEIGLVLNKLISHPQFYSYSKKPYREALVNDFPFVMLFKINESRKEVYISSILHTKRSKRRKFR